jgi:hypothetical protein
MTMTAFTGKGTGFYKGFYQMLQYRSAPGMVSFSMNNEELFKTLTSAVQKKQLQGMPRFVPGKPVEVDDRICSSMKQPVAPFPGTFPRGIKNRILIIDLMDSQPFGKGIGFSVLLLLRGLG